MKLLETSADRNEQLKDTIDKEVDHMISHIDQMGRNINDGIGSKSDEK